MDRVRAIRMAAELRGKSIGGWTVGSLINSGKSALVLEGSNGTAHAALKVFDPELIERFGAEMQVERLGREDALRGHGHSNLIEIYGTGKDRASGLFYVVMQFRPEPNLGQVRNDVPRDAIVPLISQLASAALFLENRKMCHRDIKPDNIVVSKDFDHLTLLDLGVLKHIGGKPLTDMEGKGQFIGTLQYTSPEYLLRQEKDDIEGWRALTFYQIGAVLYELIERRALFAEYLAPNQPFAALSNAVQQVIPRLESQDAPEGAIALAQSCLLKDPLQRLRFVNWDMFQLKPTGRGSIADLRERILRRRAIRTSDGAPPQANTQTKSQALEALLGLVSSAIRQVCIGTDVFPPLEMRKGLLQGTGPDLIAGFDPSPRYGLAVGLTFQFFLEVVDPNSQAVEISVAAAATTTVPCVEAPPARGRLYAGVVDAQSIAHAVGEALHAGLDAAMTIEATSADTKTTPTALIAWLDLGLAPLGVPT